MGVPLPSFSSLWTFRRSGVSSPYGGLAPMSSRCCGSIPAWFCPMMLLCGHVGRRRTHSMMALALCVVCASHLGVGVDRRRVCPHRRDVGPWCTAGANGVATVLGTMVLRGCVCVWQSRSSGPQWLFLRIGEIGDDCSVRLYPLVYLCRCGVRPLRPEGWYSMTTHPSDS